MTEKPFNILQKCNVTGDYFTKLAIWFWNCGNTVGSCPFMTFLRKPHLTEIKKRFT